MPILSSTQKVGVAHVEDSHSVWLKLDSDEETDTNLIDELFDYYSVSGDQSSATPGSLVAALSADGNWYRATILRPTESGATVHYLDYGNTEDLPLESLKVLDPKFYLQSQLAVQVSLTVSLGGSSSSQREILTKEILNSKFSATLYNIRKKWIAELTNNDGVKISEKLSSLKVVEVVKNEEIVPEIPEMVVGGRYQVTCTTADSPAQFWLLRNEEKPLFNRQQKQLQIDAPTYPSLTGIPEAGTICVAMHSLDDQWYRAEVLDADSEIITVRFDNAHTDLLYTNSGTIKQIPDSLKAAKKFAIKCRLDVIPCGAEGWNSGVCEWFQNFVTSTENIEALVIADSTPKRVELFLNGVSAADQLVARNYATKIHTEEDLIEEIVEREIDPRAAYVCHAISPSEFWIQQEDNVGDLEVLADRFMVAEMFPKVEEIKEGLLCVAKFPEDELWYRARVTSHADTGTEVIYIDYGNSAISTEIREIPEDIAEFPAFARKCCLALPEGIEKWSVDAEVEFVKMAADGATIFLLDIVEEKDDTTVVRLTLDGKDIVESLKTLCETKMPVIEERPSPIGEENSPNVIVCTVNSPYEFWTQSANAENELEDMSDRLAAIEKFSALDSFEVGTLCVAKFPEDGEWYRAKILSHGEAGTEVNYIDYGNSAVTSEIGRMPEDIAEIPALSRKCSLALPEGVEKWSMEAEIEFVKLVGDFEKNFLMDIVGENGDVTLVRLNFDDKDIAESLKEFCVTEVVEVSEERPSPVGEENSPNVFVSTVISPAEFWTQAESSVGKLEAMEEHLRTAESFLTAENIEEGTIYAAKFPEDNQWYRAKVLSHGDAGTEVNYIDYGNSAITTEELRILPEDIVKIPALSTRSALNIPDDFEAWSKEACEKFVELVNDGVTMFQCDVVEDKEEIKIVSLLLGDEDIVETLAPLCKRTTESEKPEEMTMKIKTIEEIKEELGEIRDKIERFWRSLSAQSERDSYGNCRFGLMNLPISKYSGGDFCF